MATIPRGGVCVASPVLCLLYIWPFYSRRAPLISIPSTLSLFTGINQLGAVLVIILAVLTKRSAGALSR